MRRERIRPVSAVLVGTLILLAGVGLGRQIAPRATRLGELDPVPARCVTAFAKGCTTERAAVLTRQHRPKRSGKPGRRSWYLEIPAGPFGDPYYPYLVSVPEQAGQDELAAGLALTVVFLDSRPAWLRLQSGRVLETSAAPRWGVLGQAWLTIWLLVWGIAMLGTGIWSAGRTGSWLRPAPQPGGTVLSIVLSLACAFSFFTLGRSSAPSLRPTLVSAVLGMGVGLVICVLVWLHGRRVWAAAAAADTDD